KTALLRGLPPEEARLASYSSQEKCSAAEPARVAFARHGPRPQRSPLGSEPPRPETQRQGEGPTESTHLNQPGSAVASERVNAHNVSGLGQGNRVVLGW